MLAREIMSTDVQLISPDATVQEAARAMADLDMGMLPVGENDRLVGCITDRDIALRAVAAGKSPRQCKVRDVMSPGIKYIYDDESEDDIARNMSELQVRRLPVMNRNKRLVGIISVADLALICGEEPAGQAVYRISKPS